jgi:aminomethyltransferase
MRLCGADMDEHTTVVEAGLGWIVGWKKDDFLGAAPLRAQHAGDLDRTLVAFEMVDRGIARHGHPVVVGGDVVGAVTSGTQTPFLKKAIGLAMVPVSRSAPGTSLAIDIRGRHCAAVVVPEPFYKRPKKA